MDFVSTLPRILSRFDDQRLRYALIGGLAMALRGVQRATLDADFILLSSDLAACDSTLRSLGYHRDFHSENVSHYSADDLTLGRIDLLHAFRPATLAMLERAERLPLTHDCSVPVVHIEDLIGLKIQAACNDPSRKLGDWSDIHRLVEHAGRTRHALDWELIGDYLDLFELTEQLEPLKQLHGTSPAI